MASSSPLLQGSPCLRFKFPEIQLATHDFDVLLLIGHGGFGDVYRGTITNGSTSVDAAIKRMGSKSKQGADEFWAEVDLLSVLRHCNIVSLIGYCNDGEEMILVYEHMPNGTLEDHLHELGTPLSWLQRLKICIDVGRGLHYLHTGTGFEVGIIHRDVKSSNILLQESWGAKISDFGICRIGPTNQPLTGVSTRVKGTYGYLDPDYYETGWLTRKADVYSFGVVLLEVLCRKPAVHKILVEENGTLVEEHRNLANWAQESIKNGNLELIIDSDIRHQISPECLKEFVQIVEKCLHRNREQRSAISEVMVGLESVLTLQEKANNSLHPARRRIFGRMLDMLPFVSNKDNSAHGDSKLLSSNVKGNIIKKINPAILLGEGGSGNLFLGQDDKNTFIPSSSGVKIADAVKKRGKESFQGHAERLGSAEVELFSEYCEASRYKLEEVFGKGNFGIVCSAYDTRLGKKVAIKKINDIFENVSVAASTLREIKLLRLLHHPDIVEIKNILLPPPGRKFKDIYVVFELMESNLRQVITANDDLTPKHCRFFLYQLLRGLKYAHTANVFHRDLKPENILVNADCKLKICDFGSARATFHDKPTTIFWTDYVGAKWYRAPELCGSFSSKYTPAIDMWSIGCIFAELLTGKPLFPGKNVVHQLDLMTDLLGTPSPEAISWIRNDKAKRYISSMRKKQPLPFLEKFPNADPLALRLLEKMIAFDPKDRPTAEEALSDRYFESLAKVEREPSAQPVAEIEFEFERRRITIEDLRELIFREILGYHPNTLREYLDEPTGLMHTSDFDRFKEWFDHLEEQYHRGVA